MGALAFIGLAFCVFMWGLQYKLSLYDPPQAVSHQAPHAKLLTNEEQARTAATLRAIASEPAVRIPIRGIGVLLFLWICLSVVNLPAFAQEVLSTDVSWHFGPVFFGSFFVRPPPVLL